MKTQREILARPLGVEGGWGEVSNQAKNFENKFEGYQKSIYQILEPGRAQTVLKEE